MGEYESHTSCVKLLAQLGVGENPGFINGLYKNVLRTSNLHLDSLSEREVLVQDRTKTRGKQKIGSQLI